MDPHNITTNIIFNTDAHSALCINYGLAKMAAVFMLCSDKNTCKCGIKIECSVVLLSVLLTVSTLVLVGLTTHIKLEANGGQDSRTVSAFVRHAEHRSVYLVSLASERFSTIPSCRRTKSTAVLIALILVRVEPNPGPACKRQTRRLCRQQRTVRGLNIGLVNARLAVNKAAELHALIHENLLDILVVVETWFQPDTPETIALDIAPPGFKGIGVPRSDGRRGCGLAVIYRYYLSVISAPTPSSPTSFETLTIRLAVLENTS